MLRRDFMKLLAGTGALPFLSLAELDALTLSSGNQSEAASPPHSQDFASVAIDAEGRLWAAVTERPVPECAVGVYTFSKGRFQKVVQLKPEGTTGIASPAIAAYGKGVVVCFSVEQNDRWRIGYSFIEPQTKADWRRLAVQFSGSSKAIQYLQTDGSADIAPAVAVSGDAACVVWESNAGAARGIYACTIDPSCRGTIQRLSDPFANSYNPTIAALADGRLFAAWDSVRNQSADIYGAWYDDGWQAEKRITRDTRIERHPFVAAFGNDLWMTWQLNEYYGLKINHVHIQHIGVAKIDGDTLMMPYGLYEKVSLWDRLLMRPRIAFDEQGRLYLTARESIAMQSGWLAKLWRYSGKTWSEPLTLMSQQGRWRPAPMAMGKEGVLAAVQYDDLPQVWDQRGVWEDWQCGVQIKEAANSAEPFEPLELTPYKSPETQFNLAQKMELCSAELPRQTWQIGGQTLTLFWGDLHDHTDLSVCVRSMNPPGHDLFANERDIEKLDFCVLTDHGYNFDRPQWAFNAEQTRQNHDPGRFLTFLGQEWTSSSHPRKNVRDKNVPDRDGYGHRNLIFLNPYHNEFYDAFDDNITPQELWNKLAGVEFICIPHQLADWKYKGRGNPPTDWEYVDKELQPVAEIFQERQSYEYYGCPRQAPDGYPGSGHFYLQDAWAKGIVIGVVAGPDHGGGTGKAGVWAEGLTRQSIFDAIRRRHTFGTSGAKMAIRFSAGDAMMGDQTPHPRRPIAFDIQALSMRPIRELVVFRNNEIVYQNDPKDKQLTLCWTDEHPPERTLWYYARIQCTDDEIAWSSPIWFVLPQ